MVDVEIEQATEEAMAMIDDQSWRSSNRNPDIRTIITTTMRATHYQQEGGSGGAGQGRGRGQNKGQKIAGIESRIGLPRRLDA